MTPGRADSLLPLLEGQPYLTSVKWSPAPVGLNMDGWRNHYRSELNLADMVATWLNIPHSERNKPWLTVEPKRVAEVVFCRSQRYHNDRGGWKKIWQRYGRRAVFIGFPEEHAAFCREVGPVCHYPTKDFLVLAQALAGACLVCCNQSAPRAVAEGLKVSVLVEQCDPKNTHFGRHNARYWEGDVGELPALSEEDWCI